MQKREKLLLFSLSEWRRLDSNQRPPGYEPGELPLLHSAMFSECKGTAFIDIYQIKRGE